ncbi:MAG: hypothetical protein J1E97_01060 [Muribaculaceae bacterium]|nr:hypothetical protein [Muribaculaceae bacterium]
MKKLITLLVSGLIMMSGSFFSENSGQAFAQKKTTRTTTTKHSSSKKKSSSSASASGVSKATIDKKLKKYEALVDEVHNDYYYDGEYFPPAGSGWGMFIAPVVEMKNELSGMENDMTTEQKNKFNSLTRKIKEVFTKR